MIKILILGGGFGGVRCAIDLEKKLTRSVNSPQLSSGQAGQENKAEITLVDKNNYHLFIPAIYEVASAFGLKKDKFAVQLRKTVSIPYSDIFEGKNINFIQAEIVEIDITNQKVITQGETNLDYDYLVLALGSETADFSITGINDYAYKFQNLNNAIFINQKLEELSNKFKRDQNAQPSSFLICGGGFTGIELAAELGCCTRIIKEKCRAKGRCSNITVFEAGPRIIPAIPDKERRYIKKRLTELGIIIMENSTIEEVGPDFIKLKNSKIIKGDLIIWTAGIKPNSLIQSIQGLPLTGKGKIRVDDTLQASDSDNVFAIGDNTEFIDSKNQRSIPAMAYIASDQGKIAAKNIRNLINKKPLKKYVPFYGTWVLPIGGKYAIAHISDGLVFKGLFAWIVRNIIDIRYFLSILSFKKATKLYWDEMTVFLKND